MPGQYMQYGYARHINSAEMTQFKLRGRCGAPCDRIAHLVGWILVQAGDSCAMLHGARDSLANNGVR